MKNLLLFISFFIFTLQVVGQENYTWILQPQSNINAYPEDKIVVIGVYDNKDYKIYDYQKQEFVGESYEEIIDIFLDGYSIALQGNERFVINAKGEKVFSADSYQKIHHAGSGKFWVKNNEKWGLIDEKQNIIIPIEYYIYDYDVVSNYFYILKRGVALQKNGKFAALDKEGNLISDFMYEHIIFGDELITVNMNGKYGLIDYQGNNVLPIEYQALGTFSDGLVDFSDESGLFGYRNAQGEVVIQPQFDEVSMFREGFAFVRIDDEFIFIDKKGENINKSKYIWGEMGSEFKDGVAIVTCQNWKMGMLDTKGNEIIPCQYDWIASPVDERVVLSNYKHNKYSISDLKGNIIIDKLPFEDVIILGADILLVGVESDNQYNPIDYGIIRLQ